MTPQVGSVLAGKYRIERVIGEGGMGIVVSAMHLQLDQKVAIKFLLPGAMDRADVVERFAREAKAAARVRGQHVARVIDVGELDSGAPYMVMEYLEGEDLDRTIRRGPLRVQEAVRYIVEACDALAEAHAAGIVHRDLKPGNLFIATQPGGRGIVKVLDFGISKIIESGTEALTRTSSLMGTAYYMSPEQLTSSKHVDARSDVWSLGIILYEIIIGRRPFEGSTMPEVVGRILQNQMEPMHLLRPDVPPGVEEAVSRCLQTRPELRFTNVAELANALAPFSDEDARPIVERARRVLGVPSLPPPPSVMPITAFPSAVIGLGTQTEQYAATLPIAVQSVNARLAEIERQRQGSTPPPSLPTTTGSVVREGSLSATGGTAGSPKRSPLVPALVAVGGLLVFGSAVGVAATVLRRPPPPSIPASAKGTPSATAAESVAVADTASTPPGPSSPTSAAPAPSTSSDPAASSGTPSASASGKARATKPTAVSSAAHGTATPATAPSASSGKNPLNMGLK